MSCLACVVGLLTNVKQDSGVSYLVYAAFPSTGRSRPKSGATPSMASLVAAQTRYSLISDGVGRMCEWVGGEITDLSVAIVAFRSADKGG